MHELFYSGIAAGLEPNMMSVGSGATYKPESTYGGPNPWSGGSGLGTGNGPWKSGNGGQPQYPGQGQQQPYPGQQPQSSQNHWGRRKRQIQVPNLSPLESLYAATLAGTFSMITEKKATDFFCLSLH